MHDCGTAILVLLGGGALWLAVGDRFGSRRAGVLFVLGVAALAGFLTTRPLAPLFPLNANRAVAAVVWLSLGVALSLALVEGCRQCVGKRGGTDHPTESASRPDRPRFSESGGSAFGLILIGVAGTVVTAAATSLLDLWLGLELAGIAFAAALRSDQAARRTGADGGRTTDSATLPAADSAAAIPVPVAAASTGSPAPPISEASSALLAALLFAVGIALSPSARLVDQNQAKAREAGSTDHAVTRLSAAPLPPVAVAFWVASLGLRLMAAPFHVSRWRLRDALSWRRLAWMGMLARAAPFIAWTRLLASPAGATTASVVMTGVVAACSLVVGAVLTLRESSLKALMCGAIILQTGAALVALSAGSWSFAFLDTPHPVVAFSGGQIAAAVGFAADGLAWLALCLTFDALDAPARPMTTLDDLRGLIQTSPAAGALGALAALALGGVPPLATFWGRLLGLWTVSAVRRDDVAQATLGLHPGYVALAALQAASWAALMFAALRVVDRVVFRGVVGRREPTHHRAGLLVAAILLGALLLGGALPGLFLKAAN